MTSATLSRPRYQFEPTRNGAVKLIAHQILTGDVAANFAAAKTKAPKLVEAHPASILLEVGLSRYPF